MSGVARYWKAILAALPLVVEVVTEAVQALDNGGADGTFSRDDLLKLVVAAVTPLIVYAKANTTASQAVAANESVKLTGYVPDPPAVL